MIDVKIYSKQKKIKLPNNIRSIIGKACRAVIKAENFDTPCEVGVSLVDDETIKELNSSWRGIDKVTDVLSFPAGENGRWENNPDTGLIMLGDVIISVPKAVSQAEEYGHSVEREIAFLTIHSMLHLLGYDHVNNKKEEKEMFERQNAALEILGISR